MTHTKKELREAEERHQLDRALDLATLAHAGQLDKNGNPYIGHVLRVVGRCTSFKAMTVAALHDVVEDTRITFDDLHSWSFHGDVIAAVRVLTRRKDGSQSYSDYITDVIPNRLAREVKLADLADHLDPSLPRPADYESLKPRYEKALARLTQQETANAG